MKVQLLSKIGFAVVTLGTAPSAFAQADSFDACTSLASAACVQQIGDRNSVSIDQRGASQSVATVAINGSDNGASVEQTGEGNRSVVASTQGCSWFSSRRR